MQVKNFMQLLIILALLLYGGKNGAQNLLSEVKPVLESIGGEEMREALKSAEEISTVLSAVNELTGNKNHSPQTENSTDNTENINAAFNKDGVQTESPIAFPLKPISNIADREITYSLSKYIAG